MQFLSAGNMFGNAQTGRHSEVTMFANLDQGKVRIRPGPELARGL